MTVVATILVAVIESHEELLELTAMNLYSLIHSTVKVFVIWLYLESSGALGHIVPLRYQKPRKCRCMHHDMENSFGQVPYVAHTDEKGFGPIQRDIRNEHCRYLLQPQRRSSTG